MLKTVSRDTVELMTSREIWPKGLEPFNGQGDASVPSRKHFSSTLLLFVIHHFYCPLHQLDTLLLVAYPVRHIQCAAIVTGVSYIQTSYAAVCE